METYINAIVGEIKNQINSHKTSLIRLEGIESPVIYHGICREIVAHCEDKVEIVAKLAVEKFNTFKGLEKAEWNASLNYLEQKEFIDMDNAMTKWRNSIADIQSEKPVLLLLMGTESVQDKGGLGDFYLISPDTIIEQLNGKYSRWFINILDELDKDKSAQRAIDTFFKVIYSNRNIDLENLSNLMDYIQKLNCTTVQEVVDEICYRLDRYFNIPAIKQRNKIPKVSNLKDGKVSKASIITEACQFINRLVFKKNYLKQSEIIKYSEKIDYYYEENEIDMERGFPEDEPIFNNFNEFKQVLLEFIVGKNIDKNRELLIKVDYGIISEILKTKIIVDKREKEKKITERKLKGDPISIYIHMILDSIREFAERYDEVPQDISIEVPGVKVSGCTKDNIEELNAEKQYLRAALGGIIEFLNTESLVSHDGDIIHLHYKDYEDVFSGNSESVEWSCTTKINDLTKVKFIITCSLYDLTQKTKFEWGFDRQNEWLSAFRRIIGEQSRASDGILYPSIEVKNIGHLFKCESDESFYAKMDRVQLIFNTNIIDDIHSYFSQDTYMLECFDKLIKDFNEVIEIIRDEGVFNIVQKNKMSKFINDYITFIQYINQGIGKFTAVQKEVVQVLLNSFCITATKKLSEERVIMPPYHPIMLEKLNSKFVYLRGCYKEIFDVLSSEGMKTQGILQRIQRSNQLATIECGSDVIFNHDSLMCCKRMHGTFALYEASLNQRTDNASSEIDTYVSSDKDEYQEFQVKPYAKIVYRHILDYIKTFPARCDGLNLLFINPMETHHIITAIQDVRDSLDEVGAFANINIRICLPFARKGAVDYLRSWLEELNEEETNIEIHMFVSYISSNKLDTVLNSNIIKGDKEQFDISFMYHILTPGKPEFKLCQDSEETIHGMYKFPTNTLPEPVSLSHTKRFINISQHQFDTVRAYTTLAHSISEPNAVKGEYRVQRVLDMTQVHSQFLNNLHKGCRWVVCIDEALDKGTIQDNFNKIIGFTSGEGNSGELNITLSTREDVLKDICQKLYVRLLKRFSGWSKGTIEKINEAIFKIAKDLDGTRILNALNPNDYSIYNFLAYVLVAQKLQVLESDDRYLVRALINLDTHSHWFSTAGRTQNIDLAMRPDLLLLEIENTPENIDDSSNLKIKATIIECKMGKESENTVDKAQQQIEAGLKVLAQNWNTNLVGTNQKYWYGQLYRTLVFNPIKSNDNSKEFKAISSKMSRIIEGKFDIEWHGEIYGFWLDSAEDELQEQEKITEISDDISNVVGINYLKAGQPYIKKQLNPYNLQENQSIIDEVLEEIEVDEEFEHAVVNDEEDYLEDKIDNQEVNSNNISLEVEDIVMEPNINLRGVLGVENLELKNTKKQSVLNTEEDTNQEEQIEIADQQVVVTEEMEVSPSVTRVQDIRILIGEDSRTKEKIYWEFGNKQLNNRHLLISGNSGTGKTYCIQTLMYEMTTQGVSCIVFDYTDGFTINKLDPILVTSLDDKIEQRYVFVNKFPLNPFKRLDIEIGGQLVPENIPAVASRIASVFTSVYNFGMQQNGAIYKAVRSGLEKYGDKMSFRFLVDELEELGGSVASSILSKIQVFLDIDPFDTSENFSWQDVMNQRGEIFVVQLTGFTRDIQLLLTEFILWDIWNFCVKYGDESKPLPIIIDEAQNLSHGSDSPTGKILTEGRKFGISGWFATQFLKGALKDDEIQRLQQAGQKLYFSPPEKEVMEMAKNIDINSENAKGWAEKLKKLQKGTCITAGQMVKNDRLVKYDPKVIKIISLEDRASERDRR